eukprot:scaffold2214_cov49-Phaeocystis_antarctica.AAC.5
MHRLLRPRPPCATVQRRAAPLPRRAARRPGSEQHGTAAPPSARCLRAASLCRGGGGRCALLRRDLTLTLALALSPTP